MRIVILGDELNWLEFFKFGPISLPSNFVAKLPLFLCK
jgi:hypothetical protein